MREITQELLELIRLASTDLPAAVEERLRTACQGEAKGSAARSTLETILQNVQLARQKSLPICQDTGTPLFFIQRPAEWSELQLKAQIRAAVEEATRRAWLRPNAVEAHSGSNSGNNLGDEHFPEIYVEEVEDDLLTIDLMLKGGGCENVSAQYSLPDETLQAGRDLDGVCKAALDAVWRAQGEGCAPGFLGIALGGDRATSHLAAKEALLRPLGKTNPNPQLADCESRITQEANQLGIGPMGLGGETTILGTTIASTYRLPASYYVSVAYMCWAYRRRRLTISQDRVRYE
jgi:fumarate hydratase, class I